MLGAALGTHPDIRATREELFSNHYGDVQPFNDESFNKAFRSNELILVQRYQVRDVKVIDRSCDRVISLTRETMPQYRSWRTAMATNHWRSDHPLPSEPQKIQIEFKQSEYEQWRGNIERGRKAIRPSLPTLDLTYEQLVSEWGYSTGQAHAFLGVDHMNLSPVFKKTQAFSCEYVGWPEVGYSLVE